ncbi:MAG: type III PLP-dependent enzyme, partial [Burkholderiales bacterium]|nr:type III PLP-dependent enzyme [Burkholderiales bacterium]
AGFNPRLINIGGGYPVQHMKPIPTIDEIAAVVNEGLTAFPEDVKVIGEPGRYLVSDAAYFVCRVVGTATRAGKRWMYWDAGVFGGVIETTEGLRYNIRTDRDESPLVQWTVAGPTCDSVDICMREIEFPEDMQEDDFIYIRNAGAYTTAYASNFNGFPLPEVVVF